MVDWSSNGCDVPVTVNGVRPCIRVRGIVRPVGVVDSDSTSATRRPAGMGRTEE